MLNKVLLVICRWIPKLYCSRVGVSKLKSIPRGRNLGALPDPVEYPRGKDGLSTCNALKKGGFVVLKVRGSDSMGSENTPNPPRRAILPSLRGSQAKPIRGATRLWFDLKN